LEEQANAQRAIQARQEAEARCHLAERERDVYRLLARRWQARLEAVMQQRGQAEIEEDVEDEDDEHFMLSGREQAVVFGLGSMLRTFQNGHDDDDDDDDDEDDDDDDEEEEDEEHHQGRRRRRVAMEEDGDDTAAAMVVVAAEEEEGSLRRVTTNTSTHHSMDEDDVTISSVASSALRPQARTVSITSEDL
jgi:hypothetical protein